MSEQSDSSFIKIDPEKISHQALEGLIKEFILREGTDYGVKVYTLEEKIEKVKKQLNSGIIIIAYDAELESTTLIKSEDFT